MAAVGVWPAIGHHPYGDAESVICRAGLLQEAKVLSMKLSDQEGPIAIPRRVTGGSAHLSVPLLGISGCSAWDRLAAARFMFGLSLVAIATRPSVKWKLLSLVTAIYFPALFARVHSCILESSLARLLLAFDLTQRRS